MKIKSNVFRGIVAAAVGVLVMPACFFLQHALVVGLQAASGQMAVDILGILGAFLWYIPALIPALIVFWWTTPRPVPGHCRSCGYNLTGNVSGVCPECGSRVN